MNKTILKYLTGFLLVILFTTNTQAANSENFIFLSYDQFTHLTNTEQKQYVQALQNLVVQFEGTNISQSKKKILSNTLMLFSGFLNSAEAAAETLQQKLYKESVSSRVRSNDIDEENNRIDTMLLFVNSYAQAAADHQSTGLKDDTKDTFTDTYNRLQNLSKLPLTATQKKFYDRNLTKMTEKYNKILALLPDVKIQKMDLQYLSPKVIPARPASPTSKVAKTPSSSQATSAVVSASATAASPTVASSTAPATPSTAVCIYAGFVVTTPKCTPTKILDPQFRLKELGAIEFKCKSPDEILCNPLVFGYQSDLSPYCTVRSKTASKNCQETSNNTENLARIHTAWKNPANKKVFEDFQKSLTQLCDSDPKSDDVRMTCKVVVAQFNENIKKEFPGHMTSNQLESLTKKEAAAK